MNKLYNCNSLVFLFLLCNSFNRSYGVDNHYLGLMRVESAHYNAHKITSASIKEIMFIHDLVPQEPDATRLQVHMCGCTIEKNVLTVVPTIHLVHKCVGGPWRDLKTRTLSTCMKNTDLQMGIR